MDDRCFGQTHTRDFTFVLSNTMHCIGHTISRRSSETVWHTAGITINRKQEVAYALLIGNKWNFEPT